MKWLKCIVTGLAGVLVVLFVAPIGMCTYYKLTLPPLGPNEMIGIDITYLAKLPSTWIVLTLAFSVGFLWEYRWLKRHSPSR